MFIGHIALGLAGKRLAPRTSLATLFLAVQFLDVLWPVLVLAGIEHFRIDPGNTAVTPLDFYDYPISHSLLTALGWSVLFGLVYYFISRYSRGAWVLALGVLSHWLLDFISHRPDLPLAPGSHTLAGLGLWNSAEATAVVELGLFALETWIYLRTTIARDRTGQYAFRALVILLVALQLLAYQGQAPPSEKVVAWAGLSGLLFLFWAAWIDRHRRVRGQG